MAEKLDQMQQEEILRHYILEHEWQMMLAEARARVEGDTMQEKGE